MEISEEQIQYATEVEGRTRVFKTGIMDDPKLVERLEEKISRTVLPSRRNRTSS